MTSAASRRLRLNGSKPFEALGEGPRVAGVDPLRKAARDELAVVNCMIFRAGLFEALGEGPRVAGVDPAKGRTRDALSLVLRGINRAGHLEPHKP